jgi:hypothetical protein
MWPQLMAYPLLMSAQRRNGAHQLMANGVAAWLSTISCRNINGGALKYQPMAETARPVMSAGNHQ